MLGSALDPCCVVCLSAWSSEAGANASLMAYWGRAHVQLGSSRHVLNVLGAWTAYVYIMRQTLVSRVFLDFSTHLTTSEAQRSLTNTLLQQTFTLYNRQQSLSHNLLTTLNIIINTSNDVDSAATPITQRLQQQSSHQSTTTTLKATTNTKASIITSLSISIKDAMDHLCPRLSFPLAPCMSCLSGSPASTPVTTPTTIKATKSTNFIQSMVFPVPPKSPRSPKSSSASIKQEDKRSRRPKLSIQTRLSTIPQSQVMSELQMSLAAFVIGQSNTSQAPPPSQPALSVRAMRKDSATAPWLQPIEQVRNT